jgi:hypothetical protein
MNSRTNKTSKTILKLRYSLIILVFGIAFASCTKQASLPQAIEKVGTETSGISVILPHVQISESKIQLVQANANKTAISLSWEAFACNVAEIGSYTIEASTPGTQFNGWIEIGTATTRTKDFTVKEFNAQVRKVLMTAFVDQIDIRVKVVRPNLPTLYSYLASTTVTTYQPSTDYDNSQVFRIPGNYQKWVTDKAPKIVSVSKNGEYEGYINFTDEYSQFLLLKSSLVWTDLQTYYFIGKNMFGFGGEIFAVKGGAGIYKFNVSTNTNTYSCTKINSWSMIGTAVTPDGNSDVSMTYNPNYIGWEITGSFSEGTFIFRANKSNAIVFGHNENSEIGASDYNGSPIRIAKAGKYVIRLTLASAGNYSYSIQKSVG